jgi:hypothetical protein
MYSNIGLFCSFDKLHIWNYKYLYCEWCVPLHAVKVLRSGGSAPVVFKLGSVQMCVASFTLQERLSEFSLKLSLDSIPAHMAHTYIAFRWYQVGSREVLQTRVGVWRNVWHDVGLRAHRDSERQQIWADVLYIWGNTRKIFSDSALYCLSGVTFVPPQTSILNKRIWRPLCLYQLALRSMQDLGLLQDQFPGVRNPTYFSQASNPFFFGSLSASSKQLYIGFPTGFFLLWYS